jgi:DegV family protein with EDD domain
MQMTGKQIYDSLMHGAFKVIQNKEVLNRINIFPIQDGDTGSNLSSMMQTIIKKSEYHITVKKTLESVAEAALTGARGNSGIIFAQYFRGLSETIEAADQISIHDYANASRSAAQYAYEAVENPVEGTMLTLMREWGRILSEESINNTSILDVFNRAYHTLEIALDQTKEQLSVLKKANVVDSGAKGFTYFIEGALHYLKNGEDGDLKKLIDHNEEDIIELTQVISHFDTGDYRYCTECLLESNNIDIENTKIKLKQLGNSIVVAGSRTKCRVHIHTNEPAVVFDFLSRHGTMIYQKVDDMYNQEAIINRRKYNIALVTDSIADLPRTLIDEYQIQIVHLDILYKGINYFDKLTIQPSRLLEMVSHEDELPTSSQPNPMQIDNLLDYLSTYYNSIIIISVSKELSGTYNSFYNSAKNYKNKDFNISVINSKQNSGAQGLLVKNCAEYIKAGLPHNEIVKRIEATIESSKILVQVKNLDNMIKSGRLSIRAGNIAKKIGMKPIITLDTEGKGTLESIAFSMDGSNKKIIKHMKRILSSSRIEQYNIVHVNNEAGAKELASLMTHIIGREPDYIMETSSIIAVSAGEGAVAISYLLVKEV